MSIWNDLFGGSSKRRRSKKRRVKKVSKKRTKKVSKKTGKEFVIFDKYSDKVFARIHAKTEVQAFNKWAHDTVGKSGIDHDSARIMTAARWDREQEEFKEMKRTGKVGFFR